MANPDIEIPPHRAYSIAELLHMRTTLPFVSCVVSKLSPYRDAGKFIHSEDGNPSCKLIKWQAIDVIKIPSEAYRDPDNYICSTKSLNEWRLESSEHNGSAQASSKEPTIANDDSAPTTFSNKQKTQWHLRGRNSSQNSSQPISAPTEILSQQSENFRRFHRAVASPTHVRVTAGGRIVPNIPAIEPPKLISVPATTASEAQKKLSMTDFDNTQFSQPLQDKDLLTSFNLFSMDNGQHNHSVLHTGFQFPLPSYGISNHDKTYGTRSSNGFTDSIRGISQPELGHQPIRLSNPAQLNNIKPFIYNGQVVWPAPPGFHPPPNTPAIPITMLGNPHAIPPVSPSFIAHRQSPSLAFPCGFPGLQNGLDSQSLSGTHQMTGGTLATPRVPPKFFASEITAEGVRHNLNYMENQLKNNGHQINGIEAINDRQHTTSSLREMEKMLQVQPTQEKGIAAVPLDQFKNTSPTAEFMGFTPAMKEYHNTISVGNCLPMMYPANQAEKYGELQPYTAAQSKSGPVTSSRLTLDTAKAPPFHPRCSVAALPNATSKDTSNEKPLAILPRAEGIEITERLMSASSGDWDANSRTQSAKVDWARVFRDKIDFDKARATGKRTSRAIAGKGTPKNREKSPSQSFTEGVTNVDDPQPYLVGLPPPGKSISQVQSNEYVYSRPLTAEELRARHLYWGSAPRATHTGLPRFDGKDFYPASPVKGLDSRDQSPFISPAEKIHRSSSLPKVPPPSDVPDFGDLFSDPSPIPDSVYRALSDTSDSYSQEFLKHYHKHLTEPEPSNQHERNHSNDAISSPQLSIGAPATDSPTNDKPSARMKQPVAYDTPIKRNQVHGVPNTSSTDIPSATSLADMGRTPESGQHNQHRSSAYSREANIAQRVATSESTEKHNLFLQTMLRHTTGAQMAAPVLSGAVSPMTAQGSLPLYRGSADILSPIMTGVSDPTNNMQNPLGLESFTPAYKALEHIMSLKYSIPTRADRPPLDIGAEPLLRYLAQKADEERKMAASGWNENIQGAY
ncbi:hypothetical protein F5884DRAFT_872930 [Xylogone sp. PMI_703]|nr:hypothetical protein F5884DRAFT_872930 [Xylogone sp. PMI_703]